jgi:hypothetical protein
LTVKLFHKRRIKQDENASREALLEEKKLTRRIFILNVFDFLVEVPAIICLSLVHRYGDINESFISTESNEAAIATLAFLITYILASLSHVSLLFVNICTSETFHVEFKKYYLVDNTFEKIYGEELRQNYAIGGEAL